MSEKATIPPIPDDAPPILVDYLKIWNEPDPELVRGHIDACVSEDCWWVDSQHQHTGRDALEANVREFRGRFKTANLGIGSNIDSHNGRHRYEWVIVNRGRLMIRGFDVVTVGDDGLINRVDGFFGTLDRVGPE